MSKNILQSKTFWGAIATLLLILFPGVFMLLGMSDDASMFADKLTALATTIFTIWARLQAGGVHILKG